MNSEALFFKAQVFRQLNRPKQREAVYRELIRNRPNFWFTYNELGSMYHDQGKNIEAIEFFKKAGALAPRAITPLVNLGTTYAEADRISEATAAFMASNAISLNETACENLGTIAYKRKDYEAALQLYLQAQSLSPSDYFILTDLGDCYEMLGQLQKTNEYYAKAASILSSQLQINPNDGQLWMMLAFYSAKIGNKVAAQSAILEADNHNATEVASTFIKARALALLGNKDESKRLVLLCLKQGLPAADVEIAPELSSVRSSPEYLNAAKKATKALGT